jgi:hypothetical protein
VVVAIGGVRLGVSVAEIAGHEIDGSRVQPQADFALVGDRPADDVDDVDRCAR